MDLVPSIFSTMTDGGRGHFLVDPFNVERNLREGAFDTEYFCTHVFVYSCTPLSIEPDLCEVAWLAWPTEQLAVALYMAMVVTGNSDEGVLTSDT